MASRGVQNLNYSQWKCINIDLANTRPQTVFSSVQTCGLLVDVNQPLPWFSRVGQEKNSSTRRKMSALSWFCNILLQGLTPLHVNITRSTNLLSVCRRKLKLSTYLHAVSYNHISFLKTRSQLQTSSQSLLVLWRMVTRFLQVTKFFFEKRTPTIQKKLFSLRRCHFFRFYEFLLLGNSSTAPVFSYNQ